MLYHTHLLYCCVDTFVVVVVGVQEAHRNLFPSSSHAFHSSFISCGFGSQFSCWQLLTFKPYLLSIYCRGRQRCVCSSTRLSQLSASWVVWCLLPATLGLSAPRSSDHSCPHSFPSCCLSCCLSMLYVKSILHGAWLILLCGPFPSILGRLPIMY